jgi:hypothetical protein
MGVGKRPALAVDIYIDEVVLDTPVKGGPFPEKAVAREVRRALMEAGVDADSIDAELPQALRKALWQERKP